MEWIRISAFSILCLPPEAFFQSGQHITEFAELGFDHTEKRPHLAESLFDGQSLELNPSLQTVEQRSEGLGACYDNSVIPWNIKQARPAKYLHKSTSIE